MIKRILKILLAIAAFFILILVVGMTYVAINQEKLLTQLGVSLKKNIRGELSIQKVQLNVIKDFPLLSLQLDNVLVKDSLYQKNVFNAEKVFFNLNVLKLLMLKVDVKTVTVLNGTFSLKRDSSGYFNADIFKVQSKANSSPSDINFELKKFNIENLQIISQDETQGQYISMNAKNLTGNVHRGDSVLHIVLKGDVHTDSMIFKADKGAFLVNKDANVDANLTFDIPLMLLKIQPSPIYVDDEKYNMQGFFDFKRKPAYLSLAITNPAVNFVKARTILSTVILKYMEGIEVTDPVDVAILIKGDIKPNFPPEVDASFKLRNAHVAVKGVHLSEMNMDGAFMNYVKPGVKNDDPNSALHFNIMSAKVEGIPFKAKVDIIDLVKVNIDLAASAHTPLSAINQAIPKAYQFTSGSTDVDVAYKGRLYDYLDTVARKFDDTLQGTLKISNGTFVYFERSLELKNITADVDLNANKFNFKELSGTLNGSTMHLTGVLDNVRRIFTKKADRIHGEFALNAPRIDLAKMLVVKKTALAAAPAKQATPEDMEKVAATIDQITSELTVNLKLKSDLFTFNKLAATNVSGLFTLSSYGMILKDFKLNTCKGNVLINGSLNTANRNDKLDASVSIKNVDVHQFLHDGENFNQTAIVDSNLSGTFSTDVHFSSALNSQYVPIADSMQALLHFSLKDGKLMKIQQLGEVSKYIFKKRDFSNISFAEIKDSVVLKGQQVAFKRMEIASSVVRVFVQGKYSFNGISDITIEFPLSNFKKQDLNYEPANVGVNAKSGANIFVRLKGANNKMKVSLDAGAKKRLAKDGEAYEAR